MSECVVEVGPGAVRGPGDAGEDLVATALECIADEIAFVDEQPVAVGAVWREVFCAVLPDRVDTAVLVCPTWWPSPWIERIREAAAIRSSNVIVLQRSQVLSDDVAGVSTVVEIAPEFVVVARAGRVLTAEPRLGELTDIAQSVADAVGTATVVVDAPVGVDRANELAAVITQRLSADGAAVTTVHPDRILAADWHQPVLPARPLESTKVVALAAAAVSVALVCAGVGLTSGTGGPEATAMTLLVEGRVAVKVPAQWAVQRITSGAGSARVQVLAPDNTTAVLITQSQVRNGESLSDTAATLRSALDDERSGVFSRFNPDDRRADRPTATYREAREGRQIDWAVFVDDTLRIAVGCQSAPGGEQVVRDVCEEAIRSAHAVI